MNAASLARFGRGYTMIELVLVIVILGIIGAVAGPRFFNNTAYDGRAYFDELASALRYGQKVAVASGCSVRVEVMATAYALTQQDALSGHCDASDTSFPLPVLLPSGDAVAGSAPSDFSAAPAVTFVYTPLGSTSLGADQVVSINGRNLGIESDSGLVITP